MPIVDSSLGDSNLAPSHFPVSTNTPLHMTNQVRTSRRRFIAALAGLLLVCRKAFARNGGTLDGDSVRLEKNEDGIRLVHINGDKHGYDSLSLILSELDPGQGPPLHTHECEELHVIYSGTVNYLVGGERFTLTGPFVQHIPAHTPHTFVNAGGTMVKNTAIFGSKHYTVKILGENPLLRELKPAG
jgi:quercetin dioxygenase-like cupin family protein